VCCVDVRTPPVCFVLLRLTSVPLVLVPLASLHFLRLFSSILPPNYFCLPVLGIVPTVKSDLETGIIDQANSILTGGSHANPSNILGIGLQDFSQTANNNADIIKSGGYLSQGIQ